ncbi:thiol reductant ABC exporter subunit CydD [Paenibacillus sp. HW567]|uniref:thiol reductant ABC exporter subunit CydD n=1 Tax=Paenibacillus sp. HW567 TaxID=1034769 RepID=UPI00036692F8|nr:thiol reductant ABC exporter subunit CydD [Paenibacillus sp. HW567]
MQINKNIESGRVTRFVFLVAGLLLLVIGAVGIVLPLLPTTPFWLLASFCLARSSRRLHAWLRATKFYRLNVQPLLDGKGMTLKAKLSIVLPVWGLLLLMFFRTDVLGLKILAIALGTVKTVVFARMKTAPAAPKNADSRVLDGGGASSTGTSGTEPVHTPPAGPAASPGTGGTAGKRAVPARRRLFSLARSTRRWIVLAVAVKLAGLLAGIWFAFTLGGAVQALLDGEAMSGVLGRLFLTGAGVIVIRLLLSPLAALSASRSSNGTRLELRLAVYRKLLRLETGYTRSIGTSQAVSAAIDGVEALESYFASYLPQLFYSLLAPLVLFCFVGLLDMRSALVLLVVSPLIPLLLALMLAIARKMSARHFKSYQTLGGLFLESLQGLTTLKLFRRDEERADMLREKSESFRKTTMRVLRMQLNSLTLIDLIAYGGAAGGITAAAVSARAGGLELGGAIAILLLAVEFFLPLRLLSSYFHVAMNGIAAAEKIFELLDVPESKRGQSEYGQAAAAASGGQPLPAQLSIRFDRVSFSYDGRQPALRDIDLVIEAGKTTAVVGPSGSGKSTLVSLLTRFLEQDSGTVTVGGEDINSLSVEAVRDGICLVPQNTYIFSGTLADNLRMGKPEATEAELLQACAAAGLSEFVDLAPEGLNTPVGEGGSRLSGGQRQKLGIARALLHDARVYLFDEATSNVDTESETEIGKAIWAAAREKTTLIISHRLSTIARADRIYVMDAGRIVEAGSHAELMQRRGLYFELAAGQGELLKEGEFVL